MSGHGELWTRITNRTVHGFEDEPVDALKITRVNETSVKFFGSSPGAGDFTVNVHGDIDRITGDVSVYYQLESKKGFELYRSYELKCKPAQRMF